MAKRSSGPYLHTYVHPSSVRSQGSRSSEPGLPLVYTVDCKHRFLKETSSMIAAISGFHTAFPPGYSFTFIFLISVLSLCCLSCCLVHRMTLQSPPSHWLPLPKVGGLLWATAITQQNQFSLLNSSIVLSQRGMGEKLFPHNLSPTNSPLKLSACDKLISAFLELTVAGTFTELTLLIFSWVDQDSAHDVAWTTTEQIISECACSGAAVPVFILFLKKSFHIRSVMQHSGAWCQLGLLA